MSNSQLTIFLDSTGALRAEMPGLNGSRRKVDLSPNFKKKNPEIMRLLYEGATAKREADAKIATLRAQEVAKRQIDAEAELAAKRDRFASQAAKRQAWLESLPADQRALQEELVAKKLAEAAARMTDQAKGLYIYTATKHGITVANRVVPDPKRRPGKRILFYGANGKFKEINPRTGKDANAKRPSRKRSAPIDLSQAIDL